MNGTNNKGLTIFTLASIFPWLYALPVVAGFLSLFVALKVFYLSQAGGALSFESVVDVAWPGLLFDMRWAALIGLGYWFALRIIRLLCHQKILRIIAHLLFFIVAGSLIFLFIIDVYYYQYTGRRLDSYITVLSQEQEAIGFIWQSYPIIRLLFLWVLCVGVLGWLNNLWLKHAIVGIYQKAAKIFIAPVQGLVFLFVVIAMTWGSLSQYPLRWDKLVSNNYEVLYHVKINPIQNFIDTLEKPNWLHQNADLSDASFARLSDFYRLPQANQEGKYFFRTISTENPEAKKYNVVIIILESFSYFKSSVLNGNAVDTSPFMRELAQESLVFSQFLTPNAGTARGVYATLTGIPDFLSPQTTASRTQETTIKPLLIGQLQDYESYYFIGGSSSWANIGGFLKRNSDIQVYESGQYKNSEAIDVWGISDADLFREALDVLSNRSKTEPFFAVIQTAGNHRPYTIPEKEQEFVRQSWTSKQVDDAGFSSAAELEAFRFMDYSVAIFFDKLSDQPFAQDTIVAILGDHGINKGKAHGRVPVEWENHNLINYHTPLIIHGLDREPYVDTKPASQVDLMATIASIIGAEYQSYSLGINLLDANNSAKRIAAFANNNEFRGLITAQHLYVQYDDKSLLFENLSNGYTPNYQPFDDDGQKYYYQQFLDDYITANRMLLPKHQDDK